MANKKPIAYRLGYSDASAPPSSINYRARKSVPVNSFGNPKVQTPQYEAGWDAGRKALKRKLGAKIYNKIQGMGKLEAHQYIKGLKSRR